MTSPIDNLRSDPPSAGAPPKIAKQPTLPVSGGVAAAAQESSPMPPTEAPSDQFDAPPEEAPPTELEQLSANIPMPSVVQPLAASPDVSGGGVTQQQILDAYVKPGVQRRQAASNEQAADAQAGVAAATQESVFPQLYAPPDFEQVVGDLSDSADVARSRLRSQVANDNATNAAARYAEEALRTVNQPNQGTASSTGGAFDWVGDWMGRTFGTDGNRSYVTPTYYDKDRGEYRGNFPAGLLYGLGLPQNLAIGAAIDARNITSNTYRMVPQWLRGNLEKALGVGATLMGGAGILAKAVAPWVRGENRLNDGKSNIVEAIRGAQYSFTDNAGTGVGIKRDVGVRVGKAPGKGFGFDVNPTALVGFGLDVLVGSKVDDLVGAAPRLIRKAPKAVAAAKKTAGVATKLQTSVAETRQLEIPYLPSMPAARPPKQTVAERAAEQRLVKANAVEAKRQARAAKAMPQSVQLTIPRVSPLVEAVSPLRPKGKLYNGTQAELRPGVNARQLALDLPEVKRSKPSTTALLASDAPPTPLPTLEAAPPVQLRLQLEGQPLAQLETPPAPLPDLRRPLPPELGETPLAPLVSKNVGELRLGTEVREFAVKLRPGEDAKQLALPLGVGRTPKQTVGALPKTPDVPRQGRQLYLNLRSQAANDVRNATTHDDLAAAANSLVQDSPHLEVIDDVGEVSRVTVATSKDAEGLADNALPGASENDMAAVALALDSVDVSDNVLIDVIDTLEAKPLDELFLEADRIGAKYQTPQEFAAADEALANRTTAKPGTIYHGTKDPNLTGFDFTRPGEAGRSKLGDGVYFTRAEATAADYAGSGGKVVERPAGKLKEFAYYHDFQRYMTDNSLTSTTVGKHFTDLGFDGVEILNSSKGNGFIKQVVLYRETAKEVIDDIPTVVAKALDDLPAVVADTPQAQGLANVVNARLKGKALNRITAAADEAAENAKAALNSTPDIGRRFAPEAEVRPRSVVGEMTFDVGTENRTLYHGSRVHDLDLTTADPIVGASRSELGVGHYLTLDPIVARTAAVAESASNLPGLEGRVIGQPHFRDVRVGDSKLIDASVSTPQNAELARQVAASFPELDGTFAQSESVISLYDKASAVLDEPTALEFQRHMAAAYVENGVDGVRTRNMVALYNPRAVRQGTPQMLNDNGSIVRVKAARTQLERNAVAETGSDFSKASAADALVTETAQTVEELKPLVQKHAVHTSDVIDRSGLLDDPVLPTDKEAALALRDKLTNLGGKLAKLEAKDRSAMTPRQVSTLAGQVNRLRRELFALTEEMKMLQPLEEVAPTPQQILDGYVAERKALEAMPQNTPAEQAAFDAAVAKHKQHNAARKVADDILVLQEALEVTPPNKVAKLVANIERKQQELTDILGRTPCEF